MNLNQLIAFRAVMTSASMSQAARKLGRTQPAVSLTIRALEEDLGLQLFDRQGRQLVPVPEAHYLLAEAESILNRLATVSRTMKSLAGGTAGTLNVVAMPGPAAYLFPRFISEAVGKNPDITVAISSRSSQQILELARSQSIDFGIADAPEEDDASAQYVADIIHADCMCAIPADHGLARSERVSVRDLDGVAMGVLQSGHPHHRKTRNLFIDAGLAFNKVIDSQTFLPLLQFVRTGFCVAIVDPLSVVSERALNSGKGGVVFRPMTKPIRYDYAILFPRHRPLSQLAKRVKEKWRDEFLQLLESVGAHPETAG